MYATKLKCVPAVAVLAFVVGCAANGSDASKSASGPTNDPAVRKFVETSDSAFTVAFKNSDAAGAASGYADDAVSHAPNMEAATGKAAIQQGYADLFKALGKVVDFSAQAKEVDTYSDHVIEIGDWSMSFIPTGAKDPMKDHGTYFNYWKKAADGSWKIHRDVIVSANPLPPQGPPPAAKK